LRAASLSTYHPLPPPSPSPSPLTSYSSLIPQIPSPLLHVPSPPLLLPSVNRSSDIPEVDMPSQKRLCLTKFEVGKSSTAATARQTGHTLARRVDYGFINTLDASIRSSEGRVMTAIEEVNERVTDLFTTQRQDAHEFYVQDRSMTHEACITSLEAQIKALQRDVSVLDRPRIKDGDRLTMHI
ncbi:hypothetical protein Tco_1572155, partial [Tanacetum coccineum]